jgi:predicted Fe-S protein YdhL (DUF1289 family)
MKPTGLSQIILILILLISFTGCIRRKSEVSRTFKLSEDQKVELLNDCQEMEQDGDMLEVIKEIKRDTLRIFNLLEKENPEEHTQMVTLLTDRLTENAKRAISLSRTEWTDSKWEYETVWSLGERDFKTILGRFYKDDLKILRQKIHSIYLMGQERGDLKPSVSILNQRDSLEIKYSGTASSLEACQLQRAFGIFLEVRFSDSKFIHTRYFNLIIDSKHVEVI